MQYVDWVQGLDIDPPVYMDSNILVGSLISNHPLYGKCVNLTAKLLADKVEIILSMLSVNESIWAIAKLAYCEIYKHPPKKVTWNKNIYRNQRDKIFQSYESWINSVRDAIKDWTNAGARIDVIPKTHEVFENVLNLVPVYMKEVKLTTADAIHLALAQEHARSFLTADSDFNEIQQNPPVGDLIVVKLTA
jgi:predicted nucleic acid-binding protein